MDCTTGYWMNLEPGRGQLEDGSLLPTLLIPVRRSCLVVDLAALVVDDDGFLCPTGRICPVCFLLVDDQMGDDMDDDRASIPWITTTWSLLPSLARVELESLILLGMMGSCSKELR